MEAGNPLGNRYPNHTRHWWPLVEDLLSAAEVRGLRQRIFDTLEQAHEFEVLYTDGTLLSVTLQGQAPYRASSDVRNAAGFGEDSALRWISTICGRTSSTLATRAVGSEDAERAGRGKFLN